MCDREYNGVDMRLPEEEYIDWTKWLRRLWNKRRLLLKTAIVAIVVGLVIGFSIPREYTTKVILAPESTSSSSLNSVGGLAAVAGISLRTGSGEDALSPELYPDIVSSTPFLTDLFGVRVRDSQGHIDTTLYTYLGDDLHTPWWGMLLALPVKVLHGVQNLFHKEAETASSDTLNTFCLTKQENAVAEILSRRISVSVDKKTGVTTLSVTMQDPLISAALTDTVMRSLQNYVTDYRTNKARHDLAFTEKLYEEAKANYTDAQQKYARFADANQNIVLQSYRAEQERLLNEMNLAYNVYTQMSQQLQMAKAKVQEITPVYTVVQPATVPLKPSRPAKMMILFTCIFLGEAGVMGWILFGKKTFS